MWISDSVRNKFSCQYAELKKSNEHTCQVQTVLSKRQHHFYCNIYIPWQFDTANQLNQQGPLSKNNITCSNSLGSAAFQIKCHITRNHIHNNQETKTSSPYTKQRSALNNGAAISMLQWSRIRQKNNICWRLPQHILHRVQQWCSK